MEHVENVYTLPEVAKILPSLNGRRIHSGTVWRWARHGVHGIKLETQQIGGRTVTTPEALARFLAALDERRAS